MYPEMKADHFRVVAWTTLRTILRSVTASLFLKNCGEERKTTKRASIALSHNDV